MNAQPYDAEADAESLAKPVREWARAGFLRGITGCGGVIPPGRAAMPSTAFLEAVGSDPDAPADEVEAERRSRYVEDVLARLVAIQNDAVHSHFRGALLGRVADIAVAILAVATFALLYAIDQFTHPATLAVLALIATKLAVAQYTLRRTVRLGEAAFLAREMEVRLPWGADGAVRTS